MLLHKTHPAWFYESAHKFHLFEDALLWSGNDRYPQYPGITGIHDFLWTRRTRFPGRLIFAAKECCFLHTWEVYGHSAYRLLPVHFYDHTAWPGQLLYMC